MVHFLRDGLSEWPAGEPAFDIWTVGVLVSHEALQHACLGRKTSAEGEFLWMERLSTPARFGTGTQQQDLCCQLVIAPGCPSFCVVPGATGLLQLLCLSVPKAAKSQPRERMEAWLRPGLLPLLSHLLEGFFSFGLSLSLSQFSQVAVPTSDIQDRVKHRSHSCTTFELFLMGCVTSLLKKKSITGCYVKAHHRATQEAETEEP